MKIERIKWRVKGFQELRKSGAVLDDLTARAERIAAASGEGVVARGSIGKTRARAAVIAYHPKAIRRNARDNTLLNNLDRGR